MQYDIYFHNDTDGWASAALMLGFLRSRGDDIEHFVPVTYDLEKQWMDERFFAKNKLFRGKHNPAIVVDFFYNPGAAFWFDHHETTFKKEAWRKKFKPGKFFVWDAASPSCYSAVLAALRKNFGWKPPHRFVELSKWLDVIDGARYRSAKQALAIKEPALQIDAFIEKVFDAKTAAWMIRLLAEKPIREIVALPRVQRVVAAYKNDIKKSMGFYRKNLVVEGGVAFIDLTRTKRMRLLYAPFFLHPKIAYGMRFTLRDGKWFHLSVGENPWLPSQKMHIGKLAARYGGGGHAGVGGIEFSDRRSAERAIAEIIGVLNGGLKKK